MLYRHLVLVTNPSGPAVGDLIESSLHIPRVGELVRDPNGGKAHFLCSLSQSLESRPPVGLCRRAQPH